MNRRLFLAAFYREKDLLDAVREARRRGLRIHDVYTPYPVHGLPEAMGVQPSRLGWACLGFGLPACISAFLFQSWVAALDWPVNIGGKPFFNWQSFVPVAFEFTVLCAGLGTMAALLFACRLFPGKKSRIPDWGSTDHRFVLVFVMTGTDVDRSGMERVCRTNGTVEIRECWEGDAG